MPKPRIYQTAAQRQKAYRERKIRDRATIDAAHESTQVPPPPLPNVPNIRKWRAELETAYRLAVQARDEMQAYADDRSEAWQESEAGEQLHENIEKITEAIDMFDDLTVLNITRHIYALADPRTGMVHYIGQSNNPSSRYLDHLSATGSSAAVAAWVEELKRDGLKPELRPLGKVMGITAALDEEQRQISIHAWQGHPIVNIQRY